MKHNNSWPARRAAGQVLERLGVDLTKPGTYDCKADGRRYSVFSGQVTAIWHDDHFKKDPFGRYTVVEES